MSNEITPFEAIRRTNPAGIGSGAQRPLKTVMMSRYTATLHEAVDLVRHLRRPAAKAGSTDTDQPDASAPKPVEYPEQAEARAAHMYFAKEYPPRAD